MENNITPQALIDALSSGSVHQILCALQSLQVIDATNLPPSIRAAHTSAQTAHEAALLALLSLTLPVSLLSRCEPSSSPLHPALSTLRANLALLPTLSVSTSASAALPSTLALPLPPGPDLDAASSQLAATAAAAADDLADLWASLAPSSAVSHATLPAALRNARRSFISVTPHLDLYLARTHDTTLQVAHDSLRATLSAADVDTAERATGGLSAARGRALEARSAAIKAKMRLVQTEIAERTYTPDKVAALHVIDEELRRCEDHVTTQLEEARERLREYRILGPEFERVVEEFSRVRNRLEQKQWSRRELSAGPGEME